MHNKLMSATAMVAVLTVMAATAVGVSAKTGGKHPAPTVAVARAFVAKAESDLEAEALYNNHAGWVQATYINSDTNYLVAKANAEGTNMAVRYAKEAARFDHVALDETTRRKLYLIKQGLTLPASTKPGAAQELARDHEIKALAFVGLGEGRLSGGQSDGLGRRSEQVTYGLRAGEQLRQRMRGHCLPALRSRFGLHGSFSP